VLLWGFAVFVVIAYLPYVYFQDWEWAYTRFLLPALPAMWLLITVPAIDLMQRPRREVAFILLPLVLLCVAGFSLSVATKRFAFELRDAERKYPLVSDYLQQRLPANAVILSMQHSGSIWYYTDRPIVRWDNVDPQRLDAVLAWLAANGYAPAVVGDREEIDRFKERFGPEGRRVVERATLRAQYGDAVIYTVD
jgi:hypothetical protein